MRTNTHKLSFIYNSALRFLQALKNSWSMYQIYVCVSLCCDILFRSISKSSHVEVFNWWLTKQIDHTSAWVFSCKFAPYFQNPFYSEHLWTAASEFHYIIQQSWEWYTYLEHGGISMMKLFGKIVNGLSR